MTWHDDAAMAWDLLQWEAQVQWFGKGSGRISGGRLYSKDGLIRCIENMERLGLNLYLGLNPSRPCGTKAARADITIWRYILVDLDPLPGPRRSDSTVGHMESHLQPAHNLFSGRGWQWWLVMDPLELRGRDSREIERGTAAFLRSLESQFALWKWRVDPTTSDLARIARCPGSVNQRTGQRAAFVAPARDLAPRDPGSIIALAGPEPARIQPAGVEMSHLRHVLPHLKATAREFLMWGWPEGSRHSALFHTVKSLWEVGAARDQAGEWVRHGAGLCRPPLPVGDIERTFREIWH